MFKDFSLTLPSSARNPYWAAKSQWLDSWPDTATYVLNEMRNVHVNVFGDSPVQSPANSRQVGPSQFTCYFVLLIRIDLPKSHWSFLNRPMNLLPPVSSSTFDTSLPQLVTFPLLPSFSFSSHSSASGHRRFCSEKTEARTDITTVKSVGRAGAGIPRSKAVDASTLSNTVTVPSRLSLDDASIVPLPDGSPAALSIHLHHNLNFAHLRHCSGSTHPLFVTQPCPPPIAEKQPTFLTFSLLYLTNSTVASVRHRQYLTASPKNKKEAAAQKSPRSPLHIHLSRLSTHHKPLVS